MCREKSDWERAVEFHGHKCPGLATGFRVAQIALEKLRELRSEDEELVAVVENDACGVDAVMVLTGCTLGKGNLIYRPYGKQVYTFGSRGKKKALRIAVNSEVIHGKSPVMGQLREKIAGGTATPEDQAEFNKLREQKIQEILNMPTEEFCKIQKVDFNLPGKAQIFNSVKCNSCGEYVMEPRARVKNGEFVCIPCFEDYTRGW